MLFLKNFYTEQLEGNIVGPPMHRPYSSDQHLRQRGPYGPRLLIIIDQNGDNRASDISKFI